MAGDSEKIKTTVVMRRNVWNAGKAKAASVGLGVSDYIEQLMNRDASANDVEPDGRGQQVG